MRIIAMFRTEKALAGRCPSCELPLDALGCRIVGRQRTPRAVRRRTDVFEVIEVDCLGSPTAPVQDCPCCAQGHPGHAI
jgi:hypothetical protein